MDRCAVLHIPLSQYAFANTEKGMTIRIRVKKKDLVSCTLYYGDRACRKIPMEFTEVPMKATAEDDLFEYYEAVFETPFNRVCYYFKLNDGKEWVYYYGDKFTRELPGITINHKYMEGRSEYYQYPVILREEVADVPEWFKNAVVYNIFPDSFAGGRKFISGAEQEKVLEDNHICHSRLGGTINGIRENLDYIQGLGFDCIYLNPIFAAGESHKYDVLDYYHIDPCFGTNEDFRRLVDEIHEKGMHIILDGVFNHCSWKFFAFEDVVKNGEKSLYKDWFYELNFPVIRPENEDIKPDYACFAYERKMPKFNTSNQKVQEYFTGVCRYWIREYHIDGWRLDVANEAARSFWRAFRQAAKEENPESVLIGEVWENAETWLKGDIFDSTMNYEFRNLCRDFFALGKIEAGTFSFRMNQMLLRYPDNLRDGQLNLLDSHDVPRFLSVCGDDERRFRLSVLFLMLSPGVPSLFYGDEMGIKGIEEREYRSPMEWGSANESLRSFVTQVIKLRKDYIDYHSRYSYCPAESGSRLFGFMRKGEKGNILVYLNAGEKEENLPVTEKYRIFMEDGIEAGRIKAWGYGVYSF
ncbi:glycoside hydrolase family 13 protein [Clostridium sp. Marseille-P2415]|uniref:glycoside hydrolase family 13 protein n=1 Tax=Clostridium sp. Marseille-P2415 TaxID=1805471 RepID=UPI0009887162|nr:glycoside hydrolase family 13 protein [Clostridium sp. Marseille-P2415]